MDQKSRAEELKSAGAAALSAAQYETLERIGHELVQLGQASGEMRDIAHGYNLIGNARLQNGDGPAAEEAYRRTLKIYQNLGDEARVAVILMNLGIVAIEINLDVAEGRRLYDQALPIMRRINEKTLALALGNAAEISRLEGDFTQAIAYAQESYDLFLQQSEPERAAWQLVNLAHYHSLRREYAAAKELMQRAFETLRTARNTAWVAAYFDTWFLMSTELHAWESAARVLGFVDRYRQEKKVPRLRGVLPWYLTALERLRKQLSEHELRALQEEGSAMQLLEVQTMLEKVDVRVHG